MTRIGASDPRQQPKRTREEAKEIVSDHIGVDISRLETHIEENQIAVTIADTMFLTSASTDHPDITEIYGKALSTNKNHPIVRASEGCQGWQGMSVKLYKVTVPLFPK